MYWFIIIIVLIIVILLSPTYVNIQFNFNKSFTININFRTLFGVINRKIYSKNERINKLEDKNIINRFKKLKIVYDKNKRLMNYLLNRCEVKKIKCIISFGFNDATLTGITNGFLWAIGNTMLGIFLNNRKYEDVNINIIPYFSEKKFEMNFNCIIKIKTVYIIIGGLYNIYQYTIKKGGEVFARSSN